MSCEEALVLLSGHIDEYNTPEEEAALQAHLAQCEGCRQLLHELMQAERVLGSMKEMAPADLCDGVMAQIRKETRKSARRRWSSLAVAAVLALVIGAAATIPDTEENGLAVASQAPEIVAMSRSLPAVDAEGLAVELAQERSACVVVVRELYREMETCPCETLEEGYLLYELPDRDTALALSETYGCAIYEPDENVSPSYALLVP